MAAEPLALLIRKYWPYIIVLVLAAILLSYGLSKTPVHLNQDELESALNAHSIAQNLHDTSGRLLPFYPQHLVHWWANPVMIYITALILSFLPFSEISIRLASVFIGLLTIYLIMLLTQQTFNKNRLLTFMAGLLILTTPVLFINSRLLIDQFYPVPFVLLWLVLLKKFTATKQPWALFASGLFLGIGFHSYHAAKIIIPLYFIATLVYLLPNIKKSAKVYLIFLIGFILPIAISLPSFAQNPAILGHQVSYIKGFDSRVDTAQGILGAFKPDRLISVFTDSYHTYFKLDILFITGDSSLIASTQKTGAFLIPVLFLAAFGIIYAFLRRSDRLSKLILFGLLTYPIGPIIAGQPQRISRGLVVIPFMILLAIYGTAYLLQTKDKLLKILLVILFAAVAVQFSFFLHDYYGDYRVRSYDWFNRNIGGAFESGFKSAQQNKAKAIYLDQSIPFVQRYAKFYQIKSGINLSNIQHTFNPTTLNPSDLTQNSILIIKSEHDSLIFNQANHFTKLETIFEPDNKASFYVYHYNL